MKIIRVLWCDPTKYVGINRGVSCNLEKHLTIGGDGGKVVEKNGKKTIVCRRIINDLSTDKKDDFIDVPVNLILDIEEVGQPQRVDYKEVNRIKLTKNGKNHKK